MAETFDLTTGGTTGLSDKAFRKNFVLEQEFDIGAEGPVATDIMQLIDIPVGAVVLGGELEIVTAGTASTTCTIGFTGGDVDGFLESSALDAAIGTIYPFNGDLIDIISGKHVTTADTIDMVMAGATDILGVYTVRVFGIQYELNIT